MAVRKIATIGNPILRVVARALSKEELASAKAQTLIDDLIETMADANGAGLAAPQISETVSICAIRVENNPRYPYKPNIPLTVLVNPVVEALTEETFDNYEGCLSVPNLRGLVPRWVHIRVSAWDRDGNDFVREVKGLSAGTFQHEIDHLNATIFVDRVRDTHSLATWADFEMFHKDAFVERAKALVARFGQ